MYARLGVVAKREERDAPDGAQLLFWEAGKGRCSILRELERCSERDHGLAILLYLS